MRVKEHSRKPLAGTEGQLRQQGSPPRLWAQEKGGWEVQTLVPTLFCRPGPTARWAWAPGGSRRTRPRPRPWPEQTPASSTSSSRPRTEEQCQPSAGQLRSPPSLSLSHPPKTEPNVSKKCPFQMHEALPSNFTSGVYHPAVKAG